MICKDINSKATRFEHQYKREQEERTFKTLRDIIIEAINKSDLVPKERGEGNMYWNYVSEKSKPGVDIKISEDYKNLEDQILSLIKKTSYFYVRNVISDILDKYKYENIGG